MPVEALGSVTVGFLKSTSIMRRLNDHNAQTHDIQITVEGNQ